jgi:hypothetical protein
MFQLIRFPSDSLPDIRALVQLSADQLAILAHLLDTKEAAPPVDQEFEDHVREALRVTPEAAEAVVRISLILQGTNLDVEKAVKVVEDFKELIGLEKPDDQDGLLDAIILKHQALIKVVTRKPAIARELERRYIASGTQPAIESIRTLVQLRPLFERNEQGESVDIECLIPAMTLELKYERDNREQSETFSLTEETLDELIGSLEDAKTQWALLKQKYSDQICE